MRARNRYLLAALSGVLLLLSFPPFDLEFLAWIALAPVLVAIYHTAEFKFKTATLLGIITMAIVFLPHWFEPWYSEMEGWLPTSWHWVGYPAAILVGYFITVIWGEMLAYWKPARSPSLILKYLPAGLWIIALPIVWVSVEFLVMNVPVVMKIAGALGYTSISGTQWKTVPVLQIASFTGMYGVTFLILLFNCAIAYSIVHLRDGKRAYFPAIIAILILAGVFSWGLLRVPPSSNGGISVAVIETAHGNDGSSSSTSDLLAKSLNYEPRLIMWGVPPWESPLDQLRDTDEELYPCMIHGTEFLSPNGERNHRDVAYHFINVVDGFVPWEPQRIIAPSVESFTTEFGNVGSLICMESAYPVPTRKLVDGGGQMMTTTSFNRGHAWPGLLSGNAVYRAVEFGIPAVSYGPWGGSVIIDPYGRTIEDIAPEEGIVSGNMPLVQIQTFYTRHGDLFGWGIVVLMLALVGYNIYLGRKSPFGYCQQCGTQISKGSKICQECETNPVKRPLWKRLLL
jgi:apolipoprotein N-acyltransferase